MVDFYLSKVEYYLGKKQEADDSKSEANLSPRVDEKPEDDCIIEDLDSKSSKVDIETGASSHRSSQSSKRKLSHFDLQDEYIKFKDFSEPNILKTGFILPMKCGHNGNMSINERTIYEIHLTNAGFIVPV